MYCSMEISDCNGPYLAVQGGLHLTQETSVDFPGHQHIQCALGRSISIPSAGCHSPHYSEVFARPHLTCHVSSAKWIPPQVVLSLKDN